MTGLFGAPNEQRTWRAVLSRSYDAYTELDGFGGALDRGPVLVEWSIDHDGRLRATQHRIRDEIIQDGSDLDLDWPY